jgi:hypothetical protein
MRFMFIFFMIRERKLKRKKIRKRYLKLRETTWEKYLFVLFVRRYEFVEGFKDFWVIILPKS